MYLNELFKFIVIQNVLYVFISRGYLLVNSRIVLTPFFDRFFFFLYVFEKKS